VDAARTHQMAQVDAAVGRAIQPETCKAFLARILKQRPELAKSLSRFAPGGGALVRKRSDTKYSRVGIAWDATGAFQQADPVNLFAKGIGDTDTVLGQMTIVDTNLVKGGSQDNQELFEAHAIGFRVSLVYLGTGAPAAADVADAYRSLLENTAPQLNIGNQNQMKMPPLVNYPAIGVGFQSASTVTVASATQGKQSVMSWKTPVILPAGASYSIGLSIKRALSGGIALVPGGATYFNMKMAIECVMYGVSYTGIPG